MKTTFSLFVFFIAFNLINAQTTIPDATASLFTASEGDHYIGNPSGTIFIGLANGAYQPIYKTLGEFLAFGNSAGTLTISNLADPINLQDAATKNYITAMSSNIYLGNGTLLSNRILDGAGFNLTKQNLTTYSVSANQIAQQATDQLQINATTGINLLSNTIVNADLSVTGKYFDSTNDPGLNQELLSATAPGTAWITGPNPPAKTVDFVSEKSTVKQVWGDAEELVSTINIILAEESIVDIGYNFSFYRNMDDAPDLRGVYIKISGDFISAFEVGSAHVLIRDPDIANNDSTLRYIVGRCIKSRKFKLPTGNYTFSLYTKSTIVGNDSDRTGLSPSETDADLDSNYNYTGWTYDASITPVNL